MKPFLVIALAVAVGTVVATAPHLLTAFNRFRQPAAPVPIIIVAPIASATV